MTEEEIMDGNAIIALFIGFNQVIDNNRVYFKVNDYFSEFINYDESETFNDFIRDKELKFHSSYDWLMPVVDKVFKSLVGIVEGESFRIEARIKESLLKVDIKSTWNWVVEYINWYNEKIKKYDTGRNK